MQKSLNLKNLDYNKELYVNADYDKIERILSGCVDNESRLKLAKAYLIQGKYMQAGEIYRELHEDFLLGYAHLLGGNFEITQRLWSKLEDTSPVVAWGKSLIGFINLYVTKYPTFFQIRNFLEVDLNALLCAGKYKYAENILSGLNILAEINPESYKFVSRVLLNHRQYQTAIDMSLKSLDIYYKDPETHFIIAKAYTYLLDNTHAIKYLKTCLAFHENYLPAKKLLNFLRNN